MNAGAGRRWDSRVRSWRKSCGSWVYWFPCTLALCWTPGLAEASTSKLILFQIYASLTPPTTPPPPLPFFLLIFMRWIGWEDYPLLLFDFSGRELCLLWKSFFLYWNFVICYKHFYCLHKYSIASVIHTTSLWWYRLCLNYQAFRILHKKTTVTLYSRISISVVEILFFFFFFTL